MPRVRAARAPRSADIHPRGARTTRVIAGVFPCGRGTPSTRAATTVRRRGHRLSE